MNAFALMGVLVLGLAAGTAPELAATEDAAGAADVIAHPAVAAAATAAGGTLGTTADAAANAAAQAACATLTATSHQGGIP